MKGRKGTMSTTTSLLRTASAVGLIAAAALSPSNAQAQARLDSPLLNHATFAARVPPVFGFVATAALDSAPDRVSGEVALLARVPALPPRGSRSRAITGESALLGRVD
jgi:hypothetical protein